jgi:hypothetical protein
MRCTRLIATALGLLALSFPLAEAAHWSRAYIRQLPDAAFAAVETTPLGTTIRRLPHHNAQGDLDPPHLCSAIARLVHVRWIDPANAALARRHLREHLAQVGRSGCRPSRRAGS